MQMNNQLQSQKSDLQNANVVLSDLTTRNQLIDVSLKELQNSTNEVVWESCGKAFMKVGSKQYTTKLESEKKDNSNLINDVNKKKNYLETSINNTVDNMNKVLDRIEQAHQASA